MELKNFIKEAIKDIIGAVEESQNEIKSGEVVPYAGTEYKAIELGINDIQVIEFEVTVSADEKEGSAAKLSVVAAVIGGSVQGKSDSSIGHAAKLKFYIPVRLPKSKVKS